MPAAAPSLETLYQEIFDRIRADVSPYLQELLFDLDEVVGSRLLAAEEASGAQVPLAVATTAADVDGSFARRPAPATCRSRPGSSTAPLAAVLDRGRLHRG